MTDINNELDKLAAHIKECMQIWNNAYSLVYDLNDKFKVSEGQNGEIVNIGFDDNRGDYFWLETNGDVKMSHVTNTDGCGGIMEQIKLSIKVVAFFANYNPVDVFSCLYRCLNQYGCGLKVIGSNINTNNVVKSILSSDLHRNVMAKIGKRNAVSFDIEMTFSNNFTKNKACNCVPCKLC